MRKIRGIKMEIKEQLASEFGLRLDYAGNIIELIDE